METYLEFASVYDEFMEDVPYDKWYKFIKESMVKYKVNPEIICDLGCGTGKICEYFAKDKIESIGIDNSFEMLAIAKEEALKQELNILYLNQDITEFELYGTVNVICSTCDSLNYITSEEELLQIFKLVNNYLDPGGLFIFDLNTIFKYKTILADETFVNQTDQAAYIWQNFYDEEEEINEFAVTFFIQEEDGRYKKAEEFHYQKAYPIGRVKEMLKEAGLKCMGVFDDYTDKPYTKETLRVTFIAQEIQKSK